MRFHVAGIAEDPTMYLDFGTGLLMACDLKFATLATAPEPVRPSL